MKKLVFLSVLAAGVAVALSTPKGRELVKKYTDEFTRNYREHEEKLYEVFVPQDDEIAKAKTRLDYTD